jgi:hypothetical protein
LGDLFDKQIQIRVGQGNVRAWIDELLTLVVRDDDPLGADDLVTHELPLAEAPHVYEMFQKKGRRLHQGRLASLRSPSPMPRRPSASLQPGLCNSPAL